MSETRHALLPAGYGRE